jgi:hypothetical protein
MATVTITDLPSSRALDYQAMAAIRGAGAGDWVLYAFLPYTTPVAPIPPIFNFYQTNYIADNLTVQNEDIDVRNSAPGASINVGAVQNALTVSVGPVSLPAHP